MKKAKKITLNLALSLALLTAVLMAGCASSADSEPSVAVTDDTVISESSNEETESTSVTTTESMAETTSEETTSESTIKESSTEETANEIPNDTSIEVTDTTEGTVAPSATEATLAELTAPATLDLSVPRCQIDLTNIKQSYDISYGSEIACATLVLNYLGFNVDEATLASYMPSAYSTSPITYSEIKNAIENYFSDNAIQNYTVVEQPSIDDALFLIGYGYPSILWATKDMKPSNSIVTKTINNGEEFVLLENMQCFVIIGSDSNPDIFTGIFYDPINNSIVEYSWADVLEVTSELSNQTYAFAIQGDYPLEF